TMRGAGVELALQRTDECREEIQKQPVGRHHDVAQLVLHQSTEDDRANALFLARPVDTPHGVLRLVNARHKWQSHRAELQTLELCHEAVTHRLRSHPCLVRHEENGSTAHCALRPCATGEARSVSLRESGSKLIRAPFSELRTFSERLRSPV